jgi:hypothetical protein
LASIRKSFGTFLDQILEKPDVHKVTFLGNGLSQAPVELSREFMDKGKQLEVVLVDLFSYQDFQHALQELARHWQSTFEADHLTLHPQLKLFQELTQQLLEGKVTVSPKYRFQVEPSSFTELPAEVQGTQVVVNVMGPPFSIIADQLRVFPDTGPAYLFTVVDVEEVEMPTGWQRLDVGTFDMSARGPKAVVFYWL